MFKKVIYFNKIEWEKFIDDLTDLLIKWLKEQMEIDVFLEIEKEEREKMLKEILLKEFINVCVDYDVSGVVYIDENLKFNEIWFEEDFVKALFRYNFIDKIIDKLE